MQSAAGPSAHAKHAHLHHKHIVVALSFWLVLIMFMELRFHESERWKALHQKLSLGALRFARRCHCAPPPLPIIVQAG